MTEADLAKKFIESKYFKGFDIYCEVPTHYGRCDFFAVHEPLYIAVEVKKQFSPKVIHQGLRNFAQSHYSYVAVPRPADGYAAADLCKKLGIGVLYYDAKQDKVDMQVSAAFRRRIAKPKLLDSMKDAVAGAQHNSMSEFKVCIAHIEMICARNKGRVALNELFEKDGYHYSTPRHARQAIMRYVNHGILPQFYIEKGFLILITPESPRMCSDCGQQYKECVCP